MYCSIDEAWQTNINIPIKRDEESKDKIINCSMFISHLEKCEDCKNHIKNNYCNNRNNVEHFTNDKNMNNENKNNGDMDLTFLKNNEEVMKGILFGCAMILILSVINE